MSDKTAMNDLHRRIERAREAIAVNALYSSDVEARTRAAELTSQLEREIADMEAEVAELEGRPKA